MSGLHLVTVDAPEVRAPQGVGELFLGHWCAPSGERIPGLQVVPPFGMLYKEREMNTRRARRAEQVFFGALTPSLNEAHGMDWSERQWRIVVGPWLRALIGVVISREGALSLALAEGAADSCTALVADPAALVPRDTWQAAWLASDPVWSACLDTSLLEKLIAAGVGSIHLEHAKAPYAPNTVHVAALERRRFRSVLGRSVLACARVSMRLLQRRQDTVLLSTYLPWREVIATQIWLGQFPVIPEIMEVDRDSGMTHDLELDGDARDRVADALSTAAEEPFQERVASIVAAQFPVLLFEGLPVVRAAVSQWSLPTDPETIVTANAFDYDDHFKVWLADRVGSGSRYVALQHGNNYGTHRWSNPSIAEETCDTFVTWGWQSPSGRESRGFIVKPIPCAYPPGDRLVLIEYPPPIRRTVWDEYEEFLDYFDDQLAFVAALPSEIRDTLLLRLHHESTAHSFDETRRWRAIYPRIDIDAWEASIQDLWRSSRLIVHSYDSTGILECIAAGKPFIAFWRNGLDHVQDHARPYYQLLVDAGLVHFTAASAAAKVAEVWDDPEGWWQGEEVAAARATFAESFARVSTTPARDLARILRSVR